jgi:O-antigen/teichoic acid export membrane protein
MLVYGVGTVLTKVAAFVMLPVYTHYLTPADYGIIDLIVVSLMEVATVFAGASLALGVFRFYHKAESTDEQQVLLSTALVLLSTSYAVVAGCLFFAAPQFAALLFGSTGKTVLLRIACGSLALEGVLLVPLAYLRIRERPRLFVLVQTIKLALQLVLNLVFLIPFHMGPQGMLLSGLLANSLLAPVMVTYLLRDVAFRPSWAATRQLLAFGAPLIATQMAMFVVTYGDRYFLQAAAGPGVVGLYALSYQFGFLLVALVNVPFLMVWDPIRFQVAKLPGRDRIYARCFLYLSAMLMTVGVILALLVHDLLRVMVAPAFRPAADIVPLLLAAYAFHAWANFHSIGILVRERTGFIALADWSAAIVALICYWLLIPPLLGLGAALATLAAYAVRWGIVYAVSQRLWPVQYQWTGVLQLVGVAGVLVVVGLLLPGNTLAESLTARLPLLVVLGVALRYLPMFSDEERAFILRVGRERLAALGKLIGRP